MEEIRGIQFWEIPPFPSSNVQMIHDIKNCPDEWLAELTESEKRYFNQYVLLGGVPDWKNRETWVKHVWYRIFQLPLILANEKLFEQQKKREEEALKLMEENNKKQENQ